MTTGGAVLVGVGGLGAPAAAALAASGLRRLTLVDPDVVETSNLPRQPLYGLPDIGEAKVEVAARRLAGAYPGLTIRALRARVDAANAAEILGGHDVILDGTDGLSSKVLLNQAAVALGTPLVHAGALGFDGQVLTILPGRTACLRCLFPELPDEDELPTCQQAGILGPVVGATGFVAAGEAARLVAGAPPALAGRLAILDGLRLTWRTVTVRPNPRCPLCDAAHRAGATA